MRWFHRIIVLFFSILIFTWGNITPLGAENQSLSSDLDTLLEQAFTATQKGQFSQAETYWTEIIDQYPENPAMWSNRGNIRVSQNQLNPAISDYNQSIELAPSFPDSYLNRGVAYEGLGEWEKAIADYNKVLEINPNDPVAYNNRGNAEAGLENWSAALLDYQTASDLDKNYSFARGNYALTLYQLGETELALKTMKNLVRKYPNFADMRAALTACLWDIGKLGEAESNWVAVVGLDARYKNINWVKTVRRWPPKVVTALNNFLTLK
ncbi:tetratricopeptide repeat protein [Planktothrix agardhii 1806]|uniref:tetratricopeptide repeat protein n=1 Tax=Planktothrix agardhii TaxID=1160 RepID=UPI001F3679B6|nr:tetratricopeptide repeat protein [Planktothrix agardhii]MCF3569626.1 tetratricopeptide repeat protein [Planktothrix agardhii 1805]MCF3571942.1 tetratricopeptide repeat protein [Planktothrix agardhii 1805]MCF3585164.1 tetratricopeptide repeat protein [Planktothrix agardhii 1803]MCF3601844.1 tetratricopeptide repeat protein [Planktothrix agardhii 1804]MCF3617246.1 tetratricopeptide repeat protein [Planktothrix agardhii 1806]